MLKYANITKINNVNLNNFRLNPNKIKFNKIVHVYQLKYKNGSPAGLGDFLRGSFCLMQLSKILNVKFDIDISNHPLSKYIENVTRCTNINYKNINIYTKRNEGKNKHMILNKNKIETCYDKAFINNLIDWLNKENKKVVGLFTNSFPFTTEFRKEGIEFIKSKFIPKNIIKEKIENILEKLELKKKEYSVIHIRTGDQYLIHNKNMDINFISKIKAILKSIIHENTKYLILSDSSYIKKELKNINNFYFIENEIGHLAKKNSDDVIINTLVDFFLFGHSNSITSLSVYEHESGFSKYSGILNDVPTKFIRINSIKDNNIKFITLTNTGYINYTLNCLKSLKNINFNSNLDCYCIGKEGYKILNYKKYNCLLIDEENNSNFQKFRSGNWSNITFYKFKIIYENLLTNEYVCITDGDIVFEYEYFLDYLKENILDNDILIQNDTLNDNDHSNICSGFIFIKSNAKTLDFFNPSNVKKYKNKLGWDDQVYINNNKKRLKYKLLPLELFPNGKYYYKHYKIISPYLIHFNWIIGHLKEVKMKEHKKWLIDDLDMIELNNIELICNDVSYNDVSYNDVSYNDVSFNNVSYNDVSFNDVSYNDVSYNDILL